MSLKRTLVLLAAVMTFLLPAAMLLKNQNPWSCFNFTVDESMFAQAASNWAEGKPYALGGMQAFDPIITVGIPLAWGAKYLDSITHEGIANSGRLFVYATFILTLLALARSAFKTGKQWISVPLVIGIFAYGLSKISFGGYFTFGFLGEMPAFLLGCLAYRALDDKNFIRAGIYAVAAFHMKPTFLFFLPAVGLAAVFHSMRATVRVGIGMVGSLALLFYGIAEARGQSILDYLRVFYEASSKIAQTAAGGSLLDLYPTTLESLPDSIPALLSVAFLVYGAYSLYYRRHVWPSISAAFLLFALSGAYYLVIQTRPVEKQWSAILVMSLAGFAVPWASGIAERLAGFASRELTRTVVLAVIITWVFSVGQIANHRYKKTPDNVCPSKEQTIINQKLRALADKGELTTENLGVLMPTINYDMSLYALGWNPAYARDWNGAIAKNPRWIYGETAAFTGLPPRCKFYWQGSKFSVLECAALALPEEVKPSVAPRSRGKARPKARPSGSSS